MPNYRQSQFKIETPKDVEQDGEIDTLTNSLNNLVIPPSVNWSTETASQNVDMGLHDITNTNIINAKRLTIDSLALFRTGANRITTAGNLAAYGELTGGTVGTEGTIYNNGNKGEFTPMLSINDTFINVWKKDDNVIDGIVLVKKELLKLSDNESIELALLKITKENFYIPSQNSIKLK
jgi:hypothetical protein